MRHRLSPTAPSVDQAMFAAVGIILAELYTGKVGLVGCHLTVTFEIVLPCLAPIPHVVLALYISLHPFTSRVVLAVLQCLVTWSISIPGWY